MTLPTIIPATQDADGYWHSARSSCCDALLVYYHPVAKQYVYWDGRPGDSVPAKLRCLRCSQRVEVTP